MSSIDLRKKEKNDEYLEKKSKLNFVLRFSQNQVFCKKPTVSPPYLRHGKRYRAETFFTYTRDYLGWVLFFISENIALVNFGSFFKICSSKKTSVFQGMSGILAFLFEGQKI